MQNIKNHATVIYVLIKCFSYNNIILHDVIIVVLSLSSLPTSFNQYMTREEQKMIFFFSTSLTHR